MKNPDVDASAGRMELYDWGDMKAVARLDAFDAPHFVPTRNCPTTIRSDMN